MSFTISQSVLEEYVKRQERELIRSGKLLYLLAKAPKPCKHWYASGECVHCGKEVPWE